MGHLADCVANQFRIRFDSRHQLYVFATQIHILYAGGLAFCRANANSQCPQQVPAPNTPFPETLCDTLLCGND